MDNRIVDGWIDYNKRNSHHHFSPVSSESGAVQCALGSGFSFSLLPSFSSLLATTLPSLVQSSLWEEEEDGLWLARRGLVVRRLALCSALIPVFLFTPCGRGRDTQWPNRTNSGVQCAEKLAIWQHLLRGYLFSISPHHKFLFCWESELSHCVQSSNAASNFLVTSVAPYGSQASRVWVQLDMRSTRNNSGKLFLYIHRVWYLRTVSNFDYGRKLHPHILLGDGCVLSVEVCLRKQSTIYQKDDIQYWTVLYFSFSWEICQGTLLDKSNLLCEKHRRLRCVGNPGTLRYGVAGKDALCSDTAWPMSRSSGSSPPGREICRVWHW